MAKDWAKSFYTSNRWIQCRTGYMSQPEVNYVCERCGGVATICHHKIWLTPDNIQDPDIALNWDNLFACCQDCHNYFHQSTSATRDGLAFDKKGNLIMDTPRGI